MVLGKLPVPGRPTFWMIVGQGPIALAVGADGGCLNIFTLLYFLYARLKKGRIMLYPSASVRPSVCKLFLFPCNSSYSLRPIEHSKAMRWFNAYYLEIMVQRFLAELQPFN